MPPLKIPYCSVNRKGELVCPVCQKPVSVVASAKHFGAGDAMLGAGIANCDPDGKGHQFAIRQEDANKANDILSRTQEGAWRKPLNKEFGGIPPGAMPNVDDDGKNIVIY